MTEDSFRLPRSSYDELVKIIEAYSEAREDATLDDVANLAAMNRTVVSGNNAFLSAVGVIEGGNRKTITPKGRELGFALQHQMADEIAEKWRSIVVPNEFLQKILSAVRIRRGMDPDTLQSHIAYSAGQKKTQSSSTGAIAVINVLREAELLREENGKLVAVRHIPEAGESKLTAQVTNTHPDSDADDSSLDNQAFPVHRATVSRSIDRSGLKVVLNLQVQVQSTPDELESLAPKLRRLIQEILSSREESANELS